MSKYQPLWQHLKDTDPGDTTMTFDQIAAVLGFPIDHAFLTFKKEAPAFGYQVGKISLKAQQVVFTKLV